MKDRSRIDALEVRFAQAWPGSEEPGADAAWKAGVMEAVRGEAARARAAAGPTVERLVRNAFLAAAAAAVLAALAVGSRAAVLDPSLEMAHLVASDPHALFQLVLVL